MKNRILWRYVKKNISKKDRKTVYVVLLALSQALEERGYSLSKATKLIN